MLEFKEVSHIYPGGVHALAQVSLAVKAGEFVGVVGPSGAGKSTLLRCCNGLVRPSSGKVLVEGRDITALRAKELRSLRSRIGLIFQDYNLVEPSPVFSNVLAGRLGHNPGWRSFWGIFPRGDVELAKGCLNKVGLGDLAWRRARDLSGGQKQRVAIARALAQEPTLILADEPVASLDPPTAEDIMGWFARINREQGVTVMINLHNIALARRWCQRLVGLREGRVVWDGPAASINDRIFREIFGRPPVPGELGTNAAAVV